MAGDTVIRVEGLGKRYWIQHQVQRERRGLLGRLKGGMGRRPVPSRTDGESPAAVGASVEELWALRDANFEVKRGEIVGLIGRNGAGKSTLLKILSRITEPTEGRAEIRGRVASLLEVGTGFHPELTGRENIFLNGAVLGMSRSEIARRFDEIVAFAGVEKFLDTPVKRYSSGMYVRLAFAVAAQLETEILIADEVLAVGDAEFQRKSLGKMHEAAEHGRTVLFVSHNMAAVERLCTRGLLLENGRIRVDADSRGAISEYLGISDSTVLECCPQSDPSRVAEIRRVSLCRQDGSTLSDVSVADVPFFAIEVFVREHRPDLQVALSLHDELQNPVFASSPADLDVAQPNKAGLHRYFVAFPGPLLLPRRYSVTVSLYTTSGQSIHNCQHGLSFEVIPVVTRVYTVAPNRAGLIHLSCKWTHDFDSGGSELADLQVAGTVAQ